MLDDRLEKEKAMVEDCPGHNDNEPLFKAFFLLQEKWVLFIIYALLEGTQRFNEISRKAVGVNSTTLSQRLALLEQQGIVTRTVHATIPPNTSYQLTEAGFALKEVIEAIQNWGAHHLKENGQTPPPPDCQLD